jgi:predicted RNA-binding Zn-ribbon protein involved in translation (DUF1610 family)
MNRQVFEKLLDQFAEHWIVDAEKSYNAENRRVNEAGGFPIVLKHKIKTLPCPNCGTDIDRGQHTIDLWQGLAKYKCGCKLPVFSRYKKTQNK